MDDNIKWDNFKEIAQIYGRLMVGEDRIPQGEETARYLAGVLVDIEKYRTLTKGIPYVKDDLMSDEQIGDLEKECVESLKSIDGKINKIA